MESYVTTTGLYSVSEILSNPATTGETKNGPNLYQIIKTIARNLPFFIERGTDKFGKSASFNISALLELIQVGLEFHERVESLHICAEA